MIHEVLPIICSCCRSYIVTKDWATQILKDLKEYDVNLTMDEIRCTPEKMWKKQIKQKSIENALKFLNTTQWSKSRQYIDLKMTKFLSSNVEDIQIKTAQLLTKIQLHMVKNIKISFKEQYNPNVVCNSCLLSECNQKHLFECWALIGRNQLVTYLPNYEDIFIDEDPMHSKVC